MAITSRLLAHTVGRVFPSYRTLGQWSEVYLQILDGLPVGEKTKANRRGSLSHVVGGLGRHRVISSIRPHDVSAFVMRVSKSHAPLAKRLLIESKCIFNEAVSYGWIDRNPAAQLKAPHVTVQRNRLTFEQWQLIHAHAEQTMPPWVSRMMTLALVTGQRRSDLVKMRFADVWDNHLHIEQLKTGMKLALPIELRLDVLGVTVGQAIEACRDYAVGTEYLLRKHNGKRPVDASLSARFEDAREASIPDCKSGSPTSLHECRSLAERLYRAQGIDTMTLLGHKHQAMTDMYNDDRGLTQGQWKTLALNETRQTNDYHH